MALKVSLKDKGAKGSTERRVITPRFIVRVLIAGVFLVAGVYAWHKMEQFLIRDARFAVALPDYGLESPSLQITGVQYVSRIEVLRVFAPDYGRSLYLLPLRERRRQLRTLDWIKDASISRLWPNRAVVQIQEREPVAFLNIPSDQAGVMRSALIDADGVILQAPARARFTLPVVRGISPDEHIDDRRKRVARLSSLMKDIGSLGERVSEVDVSDLENLRLTVRADRRTVVLLLGDHNFEKRFQNFITHYAKIQERLVNANTLDMRLEDRITVVESDKQ